MTTRQLDDLAALRHDWRPCAWDGVDPTLPVRWECACLMETSHPFDALCPERVRAALVRARDEGIEEAARVYEASVEATAAAAHSSAWALGCPVYTVADTGVAGRMRALKHGGPS